MYRCGLVVKQKQQHIIYIYCLLVTLILLAGSLSLLYFSLFHFSCSFSFFILFLFLVSLFFISSDHFPPFVNFPPLFHHNIQMSSSSSLSFKGTDEMRETNTSSLFFFSVFTSCVKYTDTHIDTHTHTNHTHLMHIVTPTSSIQ